MRSEAACEQVRVDLSARMDGEVTAERSRELDAHLASCAGCRTYEASLRRVKRALRLQPAPEVPDLTRSIVTAVALDGHRARTRDAWRSRGRTALVAAVIAALVVGGASLPSRTRTGDVAVADLAQEIRAAAKEITTYHAIYTVTERGWHRLVPERRMEAEVWFSAPESMRLRVTDHTRYPGRGWPINDVELVASETQWWIREPSSCPTAALPGCAIAPEVEERTLFHRQPFDGTTPVPTDIILPLETIASGDGISIEGRDDVAGRPAIHIVVPYWQAVPLVTSLQPGGSWRVPQPLDRVDLWLEEDTWFPLRFTVRRPGTSAPILEVTATAFEQPRDLDPEVFRVPASGITRDGGFDGASGAAAVTPDYLAGLRRYRSGMTSEGQAVTTYASGMSWLKVASDERTQPSFATATGELVRIGKGYGLYQPGTELLRRRIDIYTSDVHVHLESNLPRVELLRVASSLDITGRRFDELREGPGTRVERLSADEAARLPLAVTPSYLPPGYRTSTSLLSRSSRGSRLVTFYRRAETEFDGFGIRVTRAEGMTSLPPSSENLVNVRIGPIRARWSAERSELEWIDRGTYTAVAVPAFDLDMAVRIADGLR